ncbi:MAG: carboxypeptidase regulatory-like domain-containing protein, partial [Chlorobiaceae bacterium]|nr:carboxypeptidase regulatory-like domain-containing protein [Chlorobiaceae bacterium]
AQTADIKAPNSSISFIGLEADGAYDFTSAFRKNLHLELGGRMLGGVWTISAEGDPESDYAPSRYHWTTFNNHLALRLGTASSENYSLLGSTSFTGLQIGWNNRSIHKQLDAEQNNQSDGFLSIDSNELRTIEGSGPPASIAELRFDDKVVARQRIRLDGRFFFENVRMTTDLRKTEVYIYERSINEKPLKILDFSQSIASRSLPGGELLIRGGIGQTGNLFNRQPNENKGAAAFANLLYGLSDRVTVEAAMQQNPLTGSLDLLAGTVFSLGSHWTAALYGAKTNSSYGADMRVEGRYRYWHASYWGSMHNDRFGNDEKEKDLNHSFRISLNPFRNLGLQLFARHEVQGDSLLRHYILPAANWYPFSWLSLSAIPDDDENYRYEADFRIGNRSNLRAIYDSDIVTLDYQHDLSEQWKLRLINDYAVPTGDHVTNMVIDWYPRKNSSDLIQTGISYSDGAFGVAGSISRYINAGLRLSLQYSYNMNNATSLDLEDMFSDIISENAEKSVSLSLSWDLGLSNRRFFPINRSAITLTRGGIAGSLDIANETKLSSSDINNIGILLNGRSMQQRQIDGSFFVGSLKPGIYNVSVDPEKLPIELVVDQKEQKVEVKNGTVTGINIPVYAEFGVAGRITDAAGNGIANVKMVVSGKEEKPAVETVTNEFGYYRADGLRSGTYQLAAESIDGRAFGNSPKRSLTIKDDYLFDMNMTIIITQPPVKKPEISVDKKI